MIASYNRAHPWMLVGASAVDNSIPARGDRLAVSARAAPTDIQGITWCRSGRMAVPRRSACNSTCARFARGHIHLRQGASWLDEFVTELVGFPSAPFNDQVDALSQCLDYVGQNPPLDYTRFGGGERNLDTVGDVCRFQRSTGHAGPRDSPAHGQPSQRLDVIMPACAQARSQKPQKFPVFFPDAGNSRPRSLAEVRVDGEPRGRKGHRDDPIRSSKRD